MYKVCADINDVEYRPVLLDEHFQISANKLLAACDENTKIIWICSPNNPTGNSINREAIEDVLQKFEGIVIIDEAYSDFSNETPMRTELNKYPNMIVLNTMSKAWGCAAIRLGMAFASKEIIDIFNNTPGMNALACTIIAAVRRPVFNAFISRENDMNIPIPSVDSMGVGDYFKYMATLVTIYCTLIFLIQAFALFSRK